MTLPRQATAVSSPPGHLQEHIILRASLAMPLRSCRRSLKRARTKCSKAPAPECFEWFFVSSRFVMTRRKRNFVIPFVKSLKTRANAKKRRRYWLLDHQDSTPSSQARQESNTDNQQSQRTMSRIVEIFRGGQTRRSVEGRLLVLLLPQHAAERRVGSSKASSQALRSGHLADTSGCESAKPLLEA